MFRESKTLQKIAQSETFWIISYFTLLSLGVIGLAVIWIADLSFLLKIIIAIGFLGAVVPLKYYIHTEHIQNTDNQDKNNNLR